MKSYEGMFLVDAKESKKGTGSAEEHIRALVQKCGGEIKEFDKWDERRLAYEIKGTTNGTYYLAYFSGESDTIGRLNRECELSPVVLRSLFLRLKKIPDRKAADDETPPEGGEAEARGGDAGEKKADGPPAAVYNEPVRTARGEEEGDAARGGMETASEEAGETPEEGARDGDGGEAG